MSDLPIYYYSSLFFLSFTNSNAIAALTSPTPPTNVHAPAPVPEKSPGTFLVVLWGFTVVSLGLTVVSLGSGVGVGLGNVFVNTSNMLFLGLPSKFIILSLIWLSASVILYSLFAKYTIKLLVSPKSNFLVSPDCASLITIVYPVIGSLS